MPLAERSLIVVDDYMRTAEGVVQAVDEFVALTGDWIVFPIYPGQGLLIHRSWMRAQKIAVAPGLDAGRMRRCDRSVRVALLSTDS